MPIVVHVLMEHPSLTQRINGILDVELIQMPNNQVIINEITRFLTEERNRIKIELIETRECLGMNCAAASYSLGELCAIDRVIDFLEEV